VARDVTERKLIEAALENTANRLRLATKAGGVGVWEWDVANNVLTWDDQMYHLYGIPRDQFSSAYAAWSSGLHPDDRQRGDEEIQMALRGEKEFDTEFRVLWPNGEIHDIRALALVQRNAAGEPLRMIGTNWDVTEDARTKDVLRTALEHAEAGSRAKSEFLSVMSHELRTPLNGVLGYSELLGETPLNDEQKSFVTTITSSGEHLLAIVSDVLDFSSIEHHSLAIQAAPLDIAGLVGSADVAVRRTAAEKGIAFRCELASGVPAQITGDERRIRQILINLLGSAVKFTPSGSVVLRVSPDAEGRLLEFSVEDTGIGISPENLGRLFQPFVQADSKTNRRFGGTGLGLAISKRLAEAMGGTITVTTAPGKGSTFTFRLPMEISVGGIAAVPSDLFLGTDAASPSTTEIPMPSDGGIVLVVDDDKTSRMLAGKMVQSLGYCIEFAADGAEAVQAFVPEKFSAILMDMSMPIMNGLEATVKIREAEATSGGRVPIFALTANVMPGDRERCLAAGMDDFLTKPFKKPELANLLASVTRRSASVSEGVWKSTG
jgi:signal transduction histidine kinase/CheY-like chemotaxis protein